MKCDADVQTVDMFDGETGRPVRSSIAKIRRHDRFSLSVRVIQELCTWCGADRVGGCGACSDLKSK